MAQERWSTHGRLVHWRGWICEWKIIYIWHHPFRWVRVLALNFHHSSKFSGFQYILYFVELNEIFKEYILRRDPGKKFVVQTVEFLSEKTEAKEKLESENPDEVLLENPIAIPSRMVNRQVQLFFWGSVNSFNMLIFLGVLWFMSRRDPLIWKWRRRQSS